MNIPVRGNTSSFENNFLSQLLKPDCGKSVPMVIWSGAIIIRPYTAARFLKSINMTLTVLTISISSKIIVKIMRSRLKSVEEIWKPETDANKATTAATKNNIIYAIK